jgi:hypothetical protein
VPPPPGIAVKLRGRAGEPEREVMLQRGDFAMLRQIAGGKMEIKACEREYRRLHSRGLASHVFRADAAGFPHAYAALTGDGEQALAQAPFAAVA